MVVVETVVWVRCQWWRWWGEGQILNSTRECSTAFRIDTLLPLFERVLKKADLPKR